MTDVADTKLREVVIVIRIVGRVRRNFIHGVGFRIGLRIGGAMFANELKDCQKPAASLVENPLTACYYDGQKTTKNIVSNY